MKSCRTSSARLSVSPPPPAAARAAASAMARAVDVGRLGLPDNHEPSVGSVQDLDRDSVELRQRDAPAAAVEPEPHEVDPADAHGRVELAPLRQVADRLVASARSLAQHAGRACGQRYEAEDDLQQRGLARAVRPEYGDTFPSPDLGRDVAPHAPPAKRRPGPVEPYALRPRRRHRPVARASARRSASSWRTCQAWNVVPVGTSVSVTVTISIPFRRAAEVRRWTSGVAFWRL